MNEWQLLLGDVVLFSQKITIMESNNLFESIKSGIKENDFENGHFPLTFSQRLETKKYFGILPK